MKRAVAPRRILLTGVTSIHGWPLYRRLSSCADIECLFGVRSPKSEEPAAENVAPICLTDRRALAELRERFQPDCVLHAGGVCDLDVCEERPGWAEAINVEGAQNIVDVFKSSARLVYASADLVFDGVDPPEGGYREADATSPVSVVGRTIREAEKLLLAVPGSLVFRLGLPIGASVQGSKGAKDWIENRYRRGLPVTLFHDEMRSCVDCDELAEVFLQGIWQGLSGLYHLGGPRPFSLYEIGARLLRNGSFPEAVLRGIERNQEIDGPPRIGNVGLNSESLERSLARRISEPRQLSQRTEG